MHICIKYKYLLGLPLRLQQHLLVGVTRQYSTLTAHCPTVLLAIIDQRLFVEITQACGSHTLALPTNTHSDGAAGAVHSLRQHGEGHVALENGSGGESLTANGTQKSVNRLALGVPVTIDASLAEGMATGYGHRDSEGIQANDAG